MGKHVERPTSCSTSPASIPGARCRPRRATRRCWRWSSMEIRHSRPTYVAVISEHGQSSATVLVRSAQGEPQSSTISSRKVTSLASGDLVCSCRARHRSFVSSACRRWKFPARRIDCLELHYAAETKLFLAGRKHSILLSRLWLRPRQCRTGPVRGRRLAGAEGQTQEPYPRDRGAS